jgi:hypothetical protein
MLHYNDICKIHDIFKKLQNVFSTPVHVGFKQRSSTPEDGKNMTPTCSIRYSTNVMKLLRLMKIYNLSVNYNITGRFLSNKLDAFYLQGGVIQVFFATPYQHSPSHINTP